MHTPDNWVVIKVTIGSDPHYRLLVGWSGSYLTGDSWRLNSGITKVEKSGEYYDFHGSSGSVYRCHEESYGLRMNNAYIWNKISSLYGDKVHLMDEDTEWLSLSWGAKIDGRF